MLELWKGATWFWYLPGNVLVEEFGEKLLRLLLMMAQLMWFKVYECYTGAAAVLNFVGMVRVLGYWQVEFWELFSIYVAKRQMIEILIILNHSTIQKFKSLNYQRQSYCRNFYSDETVAAKCKYQLQMSFEWRIQLYFNFKSIQLRVNFILNLSQCFKFGWFGLNRFEFWSKIFSANNLPQLKVEINW